MLPREQHSGFVVAARNLRSGRYVISCTDESYTDESVRLSEPEHALILSLEPDYERVEHCRICALVYADVAFELDPLPVLCNLLRPRHVAQTQAVAPNGGNGALSFHCLDFYNLVGKCAYDVKGGILVGQVGLERSWLIAVAGCAPIGQMVVATDEDFDDAVGRAQAGDTVIRICN